MSPLFPLPVGDFGGLDLFTAADELAFNGAVDLLNVELNQPGLVRQRDGYTSFASVGFPVSFLCPSYPSGAVTVGGSLLTSFSNATPVGQNRSYSTSAVAQDDSSTARLWSTNQPTTSACIGTLRSPYRNVFIANGVDAIKNWNPNGLGWEVPSGSPPTGKFLAVWQSRIVNARMATGGAAGANGTTVRFLGAGSDVSSGAANDYIDLTGARGADPITGLVSWRELLFAFKERAITVFYGIATDSTGNAIFSNRDVDSGIGCQASQGASAGPDGVYFVNRRGIYRTVGGEPALVSRPIDPVFTGSVPATFASSALNQAQIDKCLLFWFNGRMFFSYPSGSATSNDRTFVYDPLTNSWTLWDIPMSAATSWRIADKEELFFGTPAGTIHRFGAAYTTDNGTTITSRYQSGFDNLAPPRRFAAHYLFGNTRKRIRKWKLTGSGSVAFNVAHDFNAMVAGSSRNLTLGTSPAIKDGWYQVAKRGQLFSYRISDVSGAPWTVQKLTSYLAGSEPPLLGSPADQ